jgi:hypothetical protein
MPKAQRRKPTYKAAVRFARIALELPQRHFGWRFDQIQRELDITERTLWRYVREFRNELKTISAVPLSLCSTPTRVPS